MILDDLCSVASLIPEFHAQDNESHMPIGAIGTNATSQLQEDQPNLGKFRPFAFGGQNGKKQ